jgi:predicted TIM-barrel fold metal-dependent hydrolase
VNNGFRIYDAHTHLGEARHSGRRYSAEQVLRAMDRYGVDRSLIIPFPVVEDYQKAHDQIARAVQDHPDRFAGAACLPAFLPEEEFRRELDRCAGQLGFRVLKFQPQYQPLNPISPRSDFLFAAALERDLTLVCHTGSGVPFALPSLLMLPARKHPGLRIVLAHSGGGLFFQEAIVAAALCPNVFLELSTLLPHQVMEVLAQVPGSRLMIGSDLPENLEEELGKIVRLEIPDEARADILWSTPRRVLDEA